MSEIPVPAPRFVGLDLGTRHVVVAAIDAQHNLVLTPKKIPLAQFAAWAERTLTATDAVVLEATSSEWHYVDLLQPRVARVVVADAHAVQRLNTNRVKTDARDAVALARLLAANMVTAVWVPPPHVRELRALITHRNRLLQQRTRARNRIHALLLAHMLLPPEGEPFAAKNRTWWESVPLSRAERLRLQHEYRTLDHLQPLIAEVETAIMAQSTDPAWATHSAYLIQLPGVGVITAMTVLAAIGDVTRFASAKKLVGYSGLGGSVFATGQTYRAGGISKHGRSELRAALVEAAWAAVAQEGYWKDLFTRLEARRGAGKAIVAIARRLLVVMWHVLTKHEADRHAEVARVVRKVLLWSYLLKRAGRGGTKGTEFARQELDRLGIGGDITTVKYYSMTLTLPPSRAPAAPAP